MFVITTGLVRSNSNGVGGRGFSFSENFAKQNFRPLIELNQRLLTCAYVTYLELLFQVVTVIKNDGFFLWMYMFTHPKLYTVTSKTLHSFPELILHTTT
jgi:hypothetical protein